MGWDRFSRRFLNINPKKMNHSVRLRRAFSLTKDHAHAGAMTTPYMRSSIHAKT